MTWRQSPEAFNPGGRAEQSPQTRRKTMKRALCLLVVLSLGLAGCPRQPEEEPIPPATAPEREPVQDTRTPEQERPEEERLSNGPPPEGQAFVQFIENEPYTQWKLWPGTEKMYEGTEPHGSFLTTYVNETALRAIEERSGQMPEGAVIVKENYTSEREFDSITAMYKVNGYNPEAGDWFWIKYDLEGQIEAEGKIEGCIACHQKAQDNDFLLTGGIAGEQAPASSPSPEAGS
jgi:hypothetical protein